MLILTVHRKPPHEAGGASGSDVGNDCRKQRQICHETEERRRETRKQGSDIGNVAEAEKTETTDATVF